MQFLLQWVHRCGLASISPGCDGPQGPCARTLTVATCRWSAAPNAESAAGYLVGRELVARVICAGVEAQSLVGAGALVTFHRGEGLHDPSS